MRTWAYLMGSIIPAATPSLAQCVPDINSYCISQIDLNKDS